MLLLFHLQGCTWPDSGPQLVNGTAGQPKSWQGLWNDYRVFLPTEKTVFSGARPNAYLIYRLGWNVKDDLGEITEDFAALYFGKENTKPIASILLLTQDAYLNAQSKLPYIADFGLTWATVFNPVGSRLAEFAEKTTFKDLAASNELVENATDTMQQLEKAVQSSELRNQTWWSDFQLALSKTQAHLMTLVTWRTIFWLNSSLAGASGANLTRLCEQLTQSLSTWQTIMVFWTGSAPEEGSDWEVVQPSPKLASRPNFFHAWVSFDDYIKKIQTSSPHRCAHH